MSAVGLGAILTASGLVLAGVGIWRSYLAARQVMAPLAHRGDPTRSRIESLRPLPLRPKVRTAAARTLISMGWLAIALYGLYLVVRGQAVLG